MKTQTAKHTRGRLKDLPPLTTKNDKPMRFALTAACLG
jgi:hypothetical protein